MRALATLPLDKLVAAQAALPPPATEQGAPTALLALLSLIIESLYNASREPTIAVLSLDVLAVLLRPEVAGPAFVPQVRWAS